LTPHDSSTIGQSIGGSIFSAAARCEAAHHNLLLNDPAEAWKYIAREQTEAKTCGRYK